MNRPPLSWQKYQREDVKPQQKRGGQIGGEISFYNFELQRAMWSQPHYIQISYQFAIPAC